MTKEIKLTKGQVALVDDEDYELVMQYKWWANKQGSSFRACKNRTKRDSYIYMHQLIMKNKIIDHIDGNSLNNQKYNLRICSRIQNQQNMKKHQDNQTGFKGIVLDKRDGIYSARIRFQNKSISLGRFKTPEEAAKAYDKAAKELFGEFARLNFPEE